MKGSVVCELRYLGCCWFVTAEGLPFHRTSLKVCIARTNLFINKLFAVIQNFKIPLLLATLLSQRRPSRVAPGTPRRTGAGNAFGFYSDGTQLRHIQVRHHGSANTNQI